MGKKIYIRVYPYRQKELDRLVDDILDELKEIPNVKRVEGKIGLTGTDKEKSNFKK